MNTHYTHTISQADFSPSRSVTAFTNTAAKPLPFVRVSDRSDADRERAAAFVKATLARAAATVATWTGDVTTVATYAATKETLTVSADAILRRGQDPDDAADYATGRLLIAASQREYLLQKERQEIMQIASVFRNRATFRPWQQKQLDRKYAAAHLASSLATMRGRGRVLAKWPGWAGYFKAAESERATPEAAAAYVKNAKIPAIVRASFAISYAAETGVAVGSRGELDLPADVAPLVSAGLRILQVETKRGKILAHSYEVIDAMRSAQEAGGEGEEGEKEEKGESADAESEEAPSHSEDGEDGEGSGDGTPAPGSEADAMDEYNRASPYDVRAEQKVDPSKTAGRGVTAPVNLKEYRVDAVTVKRDPSNSYIKERHAQMVRDAAPLTAALRRIVWECTEPPVFDRGQEHGAIDEGALANLAAWNDPRVFEQRQESGAAITAVHVLIDCSGSMGTGTDTRADDYCSTRISCARAVAFALCSAFAGSRFRVSVAGHQVQYGGTAKETSVRYTHAADPSAIALLDAWGDNADGYAIDHGINHLAAIPADRRILFLLADGQPCASGYGGEIARQHVRSAADSAKVRGVDFLAVGIEGTLARQGPGLFGSRFVNLEDTRSAGPLLARIIGRIAKGSA